MAEWIIDTNILVVATTAREGRPPRLLERRGEGVPVKTDNDLQEVFAWLEAVNNDRATHIIIDFPHRLIEGEYAKKIDKDEYGRMVIANKLSRCEYKMVEIERDSDGYAIILHDSAEKVTDREDRKMVAAALESGAQIANACDTDWFDLLENGTLAELGIAVHHVIEPWCRAEWKRKHGKK